MNQHTMSNHHEHGAMNRDAYAALLRTLGSHGQSTANLTLDARPQLPTPRAPLSQLSGVNVGAGSGMSQPLSSMLATQECATQPQVHSISDAIAQARLARAPYS